MSERHSPASYRPDIDGLRALAVVPVCFFHAGLPLFSGGFVGVSVFFVVSGYLMAMLIGQGLERGDFFLLDFYERRVRRIFPALFVVLSFCTAVAIVVVPPRLFQEFGVTLVATVLSVSNIVFWWKTANYFEAPTEWNPLLHTWSLAVEEQFYILFPIFLVLVWRFSWRVRFSLTLLAALASLFLSIGGTANSPTATFYLLPTRAWELLLGSLVALWTMRGGGVEPSREGSPWIGGVGGLLGLALVLGSLLWYDREMVFPGASALVPTIGAALLIHCGRDPRSQVARLLSLPPLVFVGRISYSLYLWHWPLVVFADKYGPLGTLGHIQKAAVIGFSGLVAYLSWRWIEQPFRGRRSSIGRAPLFGTLAASMATLGLAGALVQLNNGWPERFPGLASVSLGPQLAAEQRGVGGRELNASGCFVASSSDWKREGCFLGRGGESNALLWGDSFAASYARGFVGNERSSFNVLEYTSPSCPPIIGYEAASRRQCAQFNRDASDIIKRYNISTVIMAANWSVYLKRKKMRQEDIADTESILRGQGVRVVVVGQSPIFTFAYPDEYFFRAFGLQQAAREYVAPLNVDPGMNRHIAKLVARSTFFDPLAVFCQGKKCAFKRGSLYLFLDYGHYSDSGSKLAVNALLDAMNDVSVNPIRRPPQAGL